MKIILVLISLLMCLMFVSGQSIQKLIRGRVVDKKGNPITKATVFYRSDNCEIVKKCIISKIFSTKSDEEGYFEFKSESIKTGTIWTILGIEADQYTPLEPELFLYNNNAEKSKRFILSKGEVTDLGDIPIEFVYQEVNLFLGEKKTLNLDEARIRVRRANGDVINEEDFYGKINLSKNSLTFFLPEGKWVVEVRGGSTQWHRFPETISISEREQTLSLKFTPENRNSLDFITQKILSLPLNAMRNRLAELGYNLTPEALNKSILNGNIEATTLLIKLGISPNIRNENNLTPLMLAARYPEIIKVLLKLGANINARAEPLNNSEINKTDDETINLEGGNALIFAVLGGNFESVNTLLQHGISINERTTVGDTALRFAVGNNNIEIVKILLKFGANPNIKDRNGKNSIEIATERNNKDLIDLLTSKAVN